MNNRPDLGITCIIKARQLFESLMIAIYMAIIAALVIIVSLFTAPVQIDDSLVALSSHMESLGDEPDAEEHFDL